MLLNVPNHSGRLHVGQLFIWPRRHRHYAAERNQSKGATVGTFHIGDQLPNVTVQGNVLLALELFERFTETGDHRFEDGRNHLALGAAAKAATEIRCVTTLTAT